MNSTAERNTNRRKSSLTSPGGVLLLGSILLLAVYIWASFPKYGDSAQSSSTQLEASGTASQSENFDSRVRDIPMESHSSSEVTTESEDITEISENPSSAGACDELDRIPNLRVQFSTDREVDDDRCAELLASFAPQVPALPAFSGFEVSDSLRTPRRFLFEEADSPEWARAMEGRIYEETNRLLNFPTPVIHSVCRTSTCGLLFAYESSSYAGGRRNEWSQELAELLGFSGYHSGEGRIRASGMQFTYIYLGQWEMLTPEADGLVGKAIKTFEELAEQEARGRPSGAP